MKGFNDWINTNPAGDGKQLRHLWEATADYKKRYSPDVNSAHEKFMRGVRGRSLNDTPVISIKRRFKIWRVAAMLAIVLAAGIALREMFVSGNDMEHIATSLSEQKDFSLNDGTVVNLNKNSQIEFPTGFSDGERKIYLKGEAFFSVERDESKPFIVSTSVAEVKVLGTSFNVKSFEDENFIEVFVETGSVQVDVRGESKSHVLSPGEVLSFDFEENKSKISKDDPENANAWKSGKLKFKNQPMGEIFKAIEDLHGVSITATNKTLVDCPYTTTINTKELETALKGLEVACDLTFTQKTKSKYEVQGSCCE